MRSLLTAKKMAPRCWTWCCMLSKTKGFSPSPVKHRKDIFFLKNDILLTYDMYVYLEIHNYIIYDISIYDAFWSNLVCFQLHLSKWNVWCHRKLRHQNPSRHGCLHHRPSPRQASDFAGGYGSIEKNGVPMASPWVDEIFSIHCRKNGEIMGHFFFEKWTNLKILHFFQKKTHGFLRLLHIHEAATVKPWKNDFKVHRFQCWRVGGLKPNRERPFKPLYILY